VRLHDEVDDDALPSRNVQVRPRALHGTSTTPT